jgi:hypothetical protein
MHSNPSAATNASGSVGESRSRRDSERPR